jgi:hypothetical protein
MNEEEEAAAAAAYKAIEKLWASTVKARALCPLIDETAIGLDGYISSPWYQARGAVYFVNHAEPLTAKDVKELNYIGSFINRSFIISLVALLEEHKVVLFGSGPDTSKDGGNHVKLTKLLRHIPKYFKRVFPNRDLSLSIPIDAVLEPLKDGVLAYIRATISSASSW